MKRIKFRGRYYNPFSWGSLLIAIFGGLYFLAGGSLTLGSQEVVAPVAAKKEKVSTMVKAEDIAGFILENPETITEVNFDFSEGEDVSLPPYESASGLQISLEAKKYRKLVKGAIDQTIDSLNSFGGVADGDILEMNLGRVLYSLKVYQEENSFKVQEDALRHPGFELEDITMAYFTGRATEEQLWASVSIFSSDPGNSLHATSASKYVKAIVSARFYSPDRAKVRDEGAKLIGGSMLAIILTVILFCFIRKKVNSWNAKQSQNKSSE